MQDYARVSPQDRERAGSAIAQARLLGYTLYIEELPGVTAMAYVAYTVPNSDHSELIGRFLARSPTEAGAAEAGLEVLRRVVYRGDPWP